MKLTTIDNREVAPVGSRWLTEKGAKWSVIAHYGDYIELFRDGTSNDHFTWHVSSFTQTSAKRIA